MKIVIVEDEAPIREGMGRILKKIDPGYEVAGMASNVKEFQDAVASVYDEYPQYKEVVDMVRAAQ